MKKLLLSSVCRPLGPKYGDSTSVGYELLHGQVTRAQGVFSPRAVIHHFSLEYIAHNLETPTVVLQYPSEKEFIEELKKGYDVAPTSICGRVTFIMPSEWWRSFGNIHRSPRLFWEDTERS